MRLTELTPIKVLYSIFIIFLFFVHIKSIIKVVNKYLLSRVFWLNTQVTRQSHRADNQKNRITILLIIFLVTSNHNQRERAEII